MAKRAESGSESGLQVAVSAWRRAAQAMPMSEWAQVRNVCDAQGGEYSISAAERGHWCVPGAMVELLRSQGRRTKAERHAQPQASTQASGAYDGSNGAVGCEESAMDEIDEAREGCDVRGNKRAAGSETDTEGGSSSQFAHHMHKSRNKKQRYDAPLQTAVAQNTPSTAHDALTHEHEGRGRADGVVRDRARNEEEADSLTCAATAAAAANHYNAAESEQSDEDTSAPKKGKTIAGSKRPRSTKAPASYSEVKRRAPKQGQTTGGKRKREAETWPAERVALARQIAVGRRTQCRVAGRTADELYEDRILATERRGSRRKRAASEAFDDGG